MHYNLKYIEDDLYNCIYSSLYFIISLFLIQLKLCSIYNLLIILLILIELIIKDNGETFLNHGKLNLMGLFTFLIIGELLILIIICIINIINKRKYVLISVILFGALLFFIYVYIMIKDKYYCKNWDLSLNNTLIINDKSKYPCSISIPKKKCLISILSPFLDFSKLFKINCSIRKEKEKFLLKDISNLKNNKDIKRIGYPITIGDSDEIKGQPAMYSNTLLNYVKNNLINMDDKEQLNKLKKNKIPEIIVDYYDDPFGKIKINVNFDKILSIKRQSIKSNSSSNNILFIYLDNLSRVHFYRQYKKTSNFLKQFFTYEGFSTKNNTKNNKYHGFEFLKYHKFIGATLNNAIPMFSGVYYNYRNKMISIVKDLKKLGYITCNVQDICHKELMSIGKIKSYSYIEFDHEYAAPNCDPNVYTFGYGFFGGENGILRKCLYGHESFEYPLEYAKQFWIKYKNNKRFLRIVNTYAHEYSGEKSKYADDALFNFLNELYLNNELKNTTVFIAGDHGFALMGVYKLFKSEDWKIEYSMPIFILLVHDINNKTYEDQYLEIEKNQQNFITSFDIYYTIRYIIYGEDYKKPPLNGNKDDGESLFKYINPKSRTCKKYKQIEKCECKINK